jgi:hypothetical protein
LLAGAAERDVGALAVGVTAGRLEAN